MDFNPIAVFNVPGRPMVKKNTQRVFGVGSKKRAVYSPQYRFWRSVAILIMKKQPLNIQTPIELRIKFNFKNRKAEPDVSNLIEGPQDVLKEAGVIADDKLVMRIVAEKCFKGVEETIVEIYPFPVT